MGISIEPLGWVIIAAAFVVLFLVIIMVRYVEGSATKLRASVPFVVSISIFNPTQPAIIPQVVVTEEKDDKEPK